MADYYAKKLSAGRLRQCYQIAPPRVQQYLEAEINFVLDKILPGTPVLELGCGYGRLLKRLAVKTKNLAGIDTSADNLRMARSYVGLTGLKLAQMNAASPGFASRCFAAVICIQNGISAFRVDPRRVIREAVRMARPGGVVLFSSYAARFWPDRLAWFRLQAEYGLIGEIDEAATGNGVIVCKDGFRATTVGPEDFLVFTGGLGSPAVITEVDGSSLFCEIRV